MDFEEAMNTEREIVAVAHAMAIVQHDCFARFARNWVRS